MRISVQLPRPSRASALVTTLLVIVVLTIIVTAFLQSMTLERKTARSYVNRLRAELAAEAGLAEVINRLDKAVGASNFNFTVSTLDPTSEDLARLQILTKSETPRDIAKTTDLFTAGSDAKIDVVLATDTAPAIERRIGWEAIKDPSGKDIGRFAFWVDESGSKQDVITLLGRDTPKRNLLEDLGEMPLFTRANARFSTNQRDALEQEQAKEDDADETTSTTILTPKTLNAAVNALEPPADDYDFSLRSYTPLLNPEGKPRLNLNRLKRYIDGDDYEEFDVHGKRIVFVPSTGQLPLDQGPDQPRFQLVKDLLNEDGAHGAEIRNRWGYGNLEFVRRMFPEDIDRARQFVANLIDYIDSDIIPTTDGRPYEKPASGSASGAHPSNSALVLAVPSLEEAPTVMGVEARVNPLDDTKVVGHPYITYVGQGLQFNAASTRVYGWIGLAYPWSSPASWRVGTNTGYTVEMQVSLDGTCTNGSRGPKVMAESSTDAQGYFLHGWLAQESGYRNEYIGRSFSPKSYVLFPRGWHPSSFDLANGWFGESNNNPNPTPANNNFKNLQSRIEILRLIYMINGKRYLAQDLSRLRNLPREWTPTGGYKGSGSVKLGSNYNQADWHYLGDPRLNFKLQDWILAKTVSPTSSTNPGTEGVVPFGNTNVYETPVNPKKDPLDGLLPTTNEWWKSEGLTNHFPAVTDVSQSYRYRPSPLGGADAAVYNRLPESAMKSYSELGFIHTGGPWQTATLYNDPARFSPPYDDADWRLLDYIDLGLTQPRARGHKDGTPKIAGQINVNAPKRATLNALVGDVSEIESPDGLIDVLRGSDQRPYLQPSDVLNDPDFTNNTATSYAKESLIGLLYPGMTAQSTTFTAYVSGQALGNNDRPVAQATLVAEIELRYDEATAKIVPTITRKFLQ